jgi:palmitoyltransferase
MDIDDFRRRQEADLQRYQNGEQVTRRRPFHERYAHLAQSEQADDYYNNDDDAIAADSEVDEEIQSPETLNHQSIADEGEEAWVLFIDERETKLTVSHIRWRNKEGERLADFGLDEDAEFYDEDNLPLAEIMRRRKADP